MRAWFEDMEWKDWVLVWSISFVLTTAFAPLFTSGVSISAPW